MSEDLDVAPDQGRWNKLHGTVAHMTPVQAKEALHDLVDLAEEWAKHRDAEAWAWAIETTMRWPRS